jgi:hypothetical protein
MENMINTEANGTFSRYIKKIFFNGFTYKERQNLVHGITAQLAASISTPLSIYLSQLP